MKYIISYLISNNSLFFVLSRRSSSSGSSLAGDAWVAAVERLIDSESLFRNVPRDYFQSGLCYHELDANWKLRILNFLCDLVLVTK